MTPQFIKIEIADRALGPSAQFMPMFNLLGPALFDRKEFDEIRESIETSGEISLNTATVMLGAIILFDNTNQSFETIHALKFLVPQLITELDDADVSTRSLLTIRVLDRMALQYTKFKQGQPPAQSKVISIRDLKQMDSWQHLVLFIMSVELAVMKRILVEAASKLAAEEGSKIESLDSARASRPPAETAESDSPES